MDGFVQVWTEGDGDPGYPDAQNKFSPSYAGFDIDGFYEAASNASLDVHQVIQNRPWFLAHDNKTQAEWKPLENADIHNLSAIVNPASYTGIAAHAFQVAARYGGVPVASPSLLQLGPGQKPRSGLGLLKHIEILNEPNGWWRGREGYMKPYEIAAMLSAVYDAHESTLGGPGLGIKAADKDVQVVMPGVTGTSRRNLDIVRMIRLWAQSERTDGRFPADVLNFHGYSTDDQADPGDATPEQAHMLEGLRELVSWRDTFEPQMQLWLTEFGYDTAQGSPDRAKAYAQYSAEQVQAMWLVRGFMLASIARVDRAHIYMLRNVNDRGGTKFETCGLTSSKQTQWQPKLSFYWVSTITNLLGHMQIVNHTIDNTSKLYVAEFAAADTDEAAMKTASANSDSAPQAASHAFVVWLGTATGGHMSYTLRFQIDDDRSKNRHASASSITVVRLVANSTIGNQSLATTSPDTSGKGAVKLPLVITEEPVLVLIGQQPEPESGPVPPIDAPIPYSCKRRDGSTLGPGLFCDNNSTKSPLGSYRVCPSGVAEECPNGAICEQASDGVIHCADNPRSPCTGKEPGLYCDTTQTKPARGWPDGYVACPADAMFLCRSSTPHCAQNGTTVACLARNTTL